MSRWPESQVAYDVDRRIERAGLHVELRSYSDVPPGCTITTVSRPTVGMLLSARPIQARYPEGFGVSSFRRVGGVMFRPRHVPWEVLSEGGPVRTLVCVLDSERFEQLSGRSDDWSPAELAECLHVRDAAVRGSLKLIEREIRTPGFASEVLIDAAASALMVQLARSLMRGRPAGPRKPGTLTPRQLDAIDACLNEIAGRKPTVAELAEACGISGRHLLRMFRRTTGRAVADYVADRQLQKAKLMLADSNLPLKEISYRLGFSSHSSFTHAFRREAGETPSEFRRRLS